MGVSSTYSSNSAADPRLSPFRTKLRTMCAPDVSPATRATSPPPQSTFCYEPLELHSEGAPRSLQRRPTCDTSGDTHIRRHTTESGLEVGLCLPQQRRDGPHVEALPGHRPAPGPRQLTEPARERAPLARAVAWSTRKRGEGRDGAAATGARARDPRLRPPSALTRGARGGLLHKSSIKGIARFAGSDGERESVSDSSARSGPRGSGVVEHRPGHRRIRR